MRVPPRFGDLLESSALSTRLGSLGLAVVGLASLLTSAIPRTAASQTGMSAIEKLVAIEEIR